MRFQEGLQIQLRERYRRLFKSDWKTFEANAQYTLAWLDSVPALKAFVDSIANSNPDVDPTEWWDSLIERTTLPDLPSEEARAKVVLHGLAEMADEDGRSFTLMLLRLTGASKYDEMIRDFCEQWIEPSFEYLHGLLGAGSDILYLLERYRRKTAWFTQANLHERYLADTAHGEAIYQDDLQRFLFDEGIDFPFSQPESPSGKADIVALVDTDDPLTCEVKLYDGEAYRTPYLAKGVAQAYRYATDYGKTASYLVIFNLTDNTLDLPTGDRGSGWPPRLQIGEVTVFLIVVQAKPQPKASKAGKSKVVHVRRDQLVEGIS